jgi:hypothetical protein
VDPYLYSSPTCLHDVHSDFPSVLYQHRWPHETPISHLIRVATSELTTTMPINDVNIIINKDIQSIISSLRKTWQSRERKNTIINKK